MECSHDYDFSFCPEMEHTPTIANEWEIQWRWRSGCGVDSRRVSGALSSPTSSGFCKLFPLRGNGSQSKMMAYPSYIQSPWNIPRKSGSFPINLSTSQYIHMIPIISHRLWSYRVLSPSFWVKPLPFLFMANSHNIAWRNQFLPTCSPIFEWQAIQVCRFSHIFHLNFPNSYMYIYIFPSIF